MSATTPKRLPMICKNKIKKHWAKKYNDDFYLETKGCWGCGLPRMTERAHLLADHVGGSNDPDNFVLLCKHCHDHIQERWSTTKENSEHMRQLILDGAPFMDIQIRFFNDIYERNLIPQDLLIKASKKNYDIR
jgi:hypothetical protein